jgi:hypothetical protein
VSQRSPLEENEPCLKCKFSIHGKWKEQNVKCFNA